MAKPNSFIDQYRKSAVTTASPLQLVIMLYDGALRFMEAGKHSMRLQDRFEQNESLKKAQRILTELLSTLDTEKGGEVAKNLFSLYSYAHSRLVDANLEDDPEPIDECIEIISKLRESWVDLEQQSRNPAFVSEEASGAA